MKRFGFLCVFALVACGGQRQDLQLANNPDSQIVIGRDDRESSPFRASPYSMILKLLVPNSGCTASLVAPDIAITAAHCIQSSVSVQNGKKRLKNRITLHSFYDASGRYQGKAEVVNFEWGLSANSFSTRTDWALLKLNKRLGDQLGYFQLANAASGFSRSLTLAGFSYDLRGMSHHGRCKMTSKNKTYGLLHTCDTQEGASGAPLFYCQSGKCYLVAVNQGYVSAPHLGLNSNVAVDAGLAREKIHLLK